ncbi:DNA polymerase III subunit delta [Kaistella antarctica]|uniref:DNA polymerase III subunit delta n=1 Tax=Kaistella antarctica TaxID=266748 RepID=A0A448NN07_9FLAO|nr:DNA polymerase III subunit delta [Kaistella antarctica]KEY19898.1 DNA polymerase III subunit delta [Kaistella antarctica]SEV96185.1 DNA polymerase III, delta subunit [Kaistella antarctica]VEH96167.1 DNA polymerase III subunit delta [Kaistella antarctica]
MKELDLILKNIKNKELLPIYFFHGEEPFFMDVALKSFENDVLEEDEKAFNQTVVYGKDTTFSEVLSLARQFPMMGDKQVIIIKEAQDITLTDPESKALLAYVENPAESTLLVIAYKYKKVDARKAFAKILTKKKMIFLSEKIRDYNIAKWIDGEIKAIGLKAKPNIPTLLGEYLGTDLSRISNELQKLKMILKEGELLDEKIIETNIGISKDFNVFELIKALGKKDEINAFKIAHYMGKSKTHTLVMTIGNLYNFFSNLIIFQTMKGESPQNQAAAMGIAPFFLTQFADASRFYSLKHCTRAISILREIDLKSKGLGAINMTDNDLLTELVYKILHIDQYKVKV